MKLIISRTLLITGLLFWASAVMGQKSQVPEGGAVFPNPNGVPCLTTEQYTKLHTAVAKNIEDLEAANKRVFHPNRASQQVLFDWPVAQADGFDYNSTWAISNYFDHNSAFPNQIEDWDCGTRSYDTSSGYNHQGLDIYTWPFWWKQMDDDQTEVVAAQAGQIVYKNDGSYDRNCQFNNDQWNAIYVEHGDGSIAWYGHMKEGSLSTKNVGDSVTIGEYLGVIGSSGNSTGPHLHFEVYDVNNTLIDPYSGTCNDLNTSSWWNEQKSYRTPQINTLMTHDAPPEFFFGECGITEEPNESAEFSPTDDVIVAAYYRDQIAGTTASYNVKDSNGSLIAEWSQTFSDTFNGSYWYWTVATTTVEGAWEFNATYQGETITRQFTVGQLSVSDEALLQLESFPNPTDGMIHLKAAVPLEMITLYDVSGRKLYRKLNVNTIKASIDVSNFAAGVYFIRAKALNEDAEMTIRVIKK